MIQRMARSNYNAQGRNRIPEWSIHDPQKIFAYGIRIRETSKKNPDFYLLFIALAHIYNCTAESLTDHKWVIQ
jgi:hypothetical protein